MAKTIFLKCLSREVDTSWDGLRELKCFRRDIVTEVAVVVCVHSLLLGALLRHGVIVVAHGVYFMDYLHLAMDAASKWTV